MIKSEFHGPFRKKAAAPLIRWLGWYPINTEAEKDQFPHTKPGKNIPKIKWDTGRYLIVLLRIFDYLLWSIDPTDKPAWRCLKDSG